MGKICTSYAFSLRSCSSSLLSPLNYVISQLRNWHYASSMALAILHLLLLFDNILDNIFEFIFEITKACHKADNVISLHFEMFFKECNLIIYCFFKIFPFIYVKVSYRIFFHFCVFAQNICSFLIR